MKRLMVGLVVGLALLCGTVGVLVLSQAPQGFVEQTGRAFTPSPAPRLMFPYSLVPGGVRSVAELREAFRKNPAYAAQFPGFDFTRAHIVHLHRWAYVSFLKGKKVFWTSKLQLIDEDVLTDGKYFIRLKCGNAISPVPQVPTEPSVTNETLDTPELPPVSLTVPPEVTVQPVETPTGAPVYAGGSPISGLGVIYLGGGGGVPPRTPVNVPEPSEWCLAFVALNAILFTQFFKRRK
jgi:hypothetical protein